MCLGAESPIFCVMLFCEEEFVESLFEYLGALSNQRTLISLFCKASAESIPRFYTTVVFT